SIEFSETRYDRIVIASASDIPEPGKARMRLMVASQPRASLRAPAIRSRLWQREQRLSINDSEALRSILAAPISTASREMFFIVALRSRYGPAVEAIKTNPSVKIVTPSGTRTAV